MCVEDKGLSLLNLLKAPSPKKMSISSDQGQTVSAHFNPGKFFLFPI